MGLVKSIANAVKYIALHNKKGLFGIFILLFVGSIAILADKLTPYDSYAIVPPPFQPPSPEHPLGTNDIDQDIS